VGTGPEFGFAPGWSLGVEYDHRFIGRDALAFAAAPAELVTSNSIGPDVDLVTARINYWFGGPAAVRY
jgi:outer membrane immunogenic protein